MGQCDRKEIVSRSRYIGMTRSRPNVQQKHSDGFTLVELLVVIAIIGILVALLLPAIQAAREAARRAQCQNNLKNVSLAVLNYESSSKTLPMGTVFPQLDGNGLVTPAINSNVDFGRSWIVIVLPYMENQALYDSFIFKDPTSGAAVPMRDARISPSAVPCCRPCCALPIHEIK